MSETSSIRNSQRASAFLNRPHIAPMGPRTRQGTMRTTSLLSQSSAPVPPRVNTLNLPEFGGRMSPEIMSPESSLSTSTRKSLQPMTEEPPSPASVLTNDQPFNLLRNALSPLRIEEDEEDEGQQLLFPEFLSSGPPTARPPNTLRTPSPEEETSLLPYEQPVDPDSEYAVPDSPPPTFEASLEQERETSFHEPSIREPSIREPSIRESSIREPSIRELSIREPSIREPSIREPSIREPAIDEASARESLIPEPSLYEPSVQEPPAREERSVRESVLSTKSSVASVSQIPPSPAPSKTSFSLSTVAKITPPPPIKFESTPVPWKGLPMEAAVWTVDSGELQGIVSRAIRSSASESFVRLLTADNLDKVLPAELERLEHLKAVSQSKYRFLVHRRTMLFQALNSTSLGQQKDGDDGVSVVSRLASQLADTISECDQRLEEVLQITDQMAQINKLIDVHWSSALAIALRKLNGSFARRNTDLTAAKERIIQLEAELSEAWKEAERMARELDDYEAAIAADDDEAIIETAEVVAVPKPNHTRRASTPMTPTLVEFMPKSISPTQNMTESTSTSPMRSPIVAASIPAPLRSPNPNQQFTFPQTPSGVPITHLKQKEPQVEPDVPDTVSLRSTRSGRSVRSTKSHTSESNTANYVTAVHAAKTRSRRMSESSLRLAISPTAGPGGHVRKLSAGRTPRTTPYEEHPPVPELPVQYSLFNAIASVNASSALPHNPDNTPARGMAYMSMSLLHPSPRLRRQVSLDSVLTGGGRSIITNPGSVAYKGKTAAADDLYLRPNQHAIRDYDYHHHPSGMTDGESEIQMMSRTPRANTFGYNSRPGTSSLAYYDSAGMYTAPRPPPKDPSNGIPSMWMNADAGVGHTHKHSLSSSPPSAYAHAQRQPQQLSPSNPGSVNSSIRSPVSNSSENDGHAQEVQEGNSTSMLSQQSSSSNLKTAAYNKLKGLKKRYSVSLPMFSSHARATPRKSA